MVMYLEFFICNVYFHASWPPTRRARPDRIPVFCFVIVGLFDHESPLVVTPLKTLANSLDSDQAHNFDKVSTAHARISTASLCISCMRDTAAKSGFLVM